MEKVELYSFDYKINGTTYSGHIPALGFEDAETKVSKFGAKVYGKLIESQCARCGLIDGDGTPEVSPYNFPDIIGD